MRLLFALVVAGALMALASLPGAASAAVCADHANQAEAQRAADTRDGDGDGVYCESLPCPCAGPGDGGGSSSAPPPSPRKATCARPGGVRRIVFSRRRYPNMRRHHAAAVRAGWPRILVVNRRGIDARRDRALRGMPTRAGRDRDEYPPAVGRGRGRAALKRGTDPTGWRASVRYVPSRENRSHGAVLGSRLRGFCDGTRFRYIFR